MPPWHFQSPSGIRPPPPAAAGLLAACVLGLGLSACLESRDVASVDNPPAVDSLPLAPRGFPPVPYPEGGAPTPARIALGRRLFFDGRLSRDGSVSCATCHRPEGSFADPGKSFTFGIDGHLTGRNSPSLANVGYDTSFFADGSAPTLERQALAPILNPLEMDMDTARLPSRLASVGLYRDLFRKAWGDDTVTVARILGSIASFERAMLSGDSPYDRSLAGDDKALSQGARRGRDLFFGGKAACFRCHGGFAFTDRGFHNTGLDSFNLDPGRIAVTGLPFDDGKFKTPPLRNVAVTPPYMHDGRFNTLREVIAHYNSGGLAVPLRDPLLGPLGLDEGEIGDLILFLESLTDSAFVDDPDFRDPGKP
jgi:cytochrome c peroxidase